MGPSGSRSASRAWDPSGQLSGQQKSDDETDKRHAHDDEDEKPDRTRDPGHQRILRLTFANPAVNETPEDSHHDEEAPARTDPRPMSRDRDALPFPVYGRLRMGHRARGGWSRGVGDREDRQQTPHRLSQDGSNHEASPIA